jgi:CRISPR-associated protein Csm2
MAISDAEMKTIITDPNGMELLVAKAKELGEGLFHNQMTTAQIRALFGEVRQIEAEWGNEDEKKKREAYRRLVLLKPKLAYRARKERGQAVKMLTDVLDKGLDVIIKGDISKRDESFRQFVEFFEAILAYHQAAGGK